MATRLFLTIWMTYLIHFNPTHTGANRFVYLMMALVEHQSIATDKVAVIYPADIMEFNGSHFCNTNPGISFIAAPFWAISRRLLPAAEGTQTVSDLAVSFFIAHFVATAATTAALSSLAAVVLACFVCRRTGSVNRAVLACLLYAFGTIAFHFSTHLNQNCVIAAIAVLVFAEVFAPGILGIRREWLRWGVIGALLGLATFVDLSILPFAMVMLVPILSGTRGAISSVAALVGGALPPLAALAGYLHSAFGNPFLPPQSYYPILGHTGVLHFITQLNVARFLEQIVLPTHGLLPFMPFTLLSSWFLVRRWRLETAHRREHRVVGAIVFAYLLYVAFNAGAVFTQFGPRYLMPILPFLTLIFALHVQAKNLVVAAPLVIVSVLINVAGAMLGYGTDNLFRYLGLLFLRGPWQPILDWLANSDLHQLVLPKLISPLGPLLFLVAFLLVVWSVPLATLIVGSKGSGARVT